MEDGYMISVKKSRPANQVIKGESSLWRAAADGSIDHGTIP